VSQTLEIHKPATAHRLRFPNLIIQVHLNAPYNTIAKMSTHNSPSHQLKPVDLPSHTPASSEPAMPNSNLDVFYKPLDHFDEYKQWVASGGLREFAAEYSLQENFILWDLDTPAYLAYIRRTHKIPGLDDSIQAYRAATLGPPRSVSECMEDMAIIEG